jgi:hypothetical protein
VVESRKDLVAKPPGYFQTAAYVVVVGAETLDLYRRHGVLLSRIRIVHPNKQSAQSRRTPVDIELTKPARKKGEFQGTIHQKLITTGRNSM